MIDDNRTELGWDNTKYATTYRDRLNTYRKDLAGAQAALIGDLRESYRQGTTAMVADLLRYTRPWGFRLDQVTTTVHLWHGEQDPKVPITVARQLAETGRVGQDSYDAARQLLGDTGLVELVSLCGYYTLISFLLNAFEVPLPPGAAPTWNTTNP